jgi:hypothetical protein
MDTPPTTNSGPLTTFEDLLAWQEQSGQIVPPFSPEEKTLACRVAQAYYWR